MWPRWMSAVVGSIPSLTRSGRPSESCSSSLPAGRTSTAFRARSMDFNFRASLAARRLRHARLLVPRSWGNARLPPSLGGSTPMPSLLMVRLGLKPRRRGGTEPPPATKPTPEKPRRPRLKKLRILFVLLGLAVLGLVSFVFGMMAAVAQDLPAIYNFAQYKASRNSVVVGDNGEELGTLTSDQNKILLNSSQISPNAKNAVVSIEDSRFYEHSGVDFKGHRPRPRPRHPQPERRTGRLDDHPAVRQAGAGSGKQPHRPREVPRGGARLPARETLEQGQDPHRVPEHDLFRRGRLRDRGRGPHLLRSRPPRLRHLDRTLRGRARALRGGDAGGDHPVALRLRPEDLPRKRPRAPQPGARKDVRTGLHLPGTDDRRPAARAALAEQHRTADLRIEGALLRRLPAPAAARTLRGLEGVLRRPQDQVDARPAAAGSGRRNDRLLPRLSAGDRLGGRDRQPQRRRSRPWSAAPTSSRPRSTSPPRGAASPGHRSSRSR